MRGMTNVVILGNLARDPDVHENYVKLIISVEASKPGKDGVSQKTIDFIPAAVFGSNTKYASMLHKGDYVNITGTIKTHKNKRGFFMDVLVKKIMRLYSAQKVNSDSYSA